MTGFRIGTIMLGTTDLERALKFYGTILELPVQFQSTEMAFLDAGATEVVFVVESVRATESSPFLVETLYGS